MKLTVFDDHLEARGPFAFRGSQWIVLDAAGRSKVGFRTLNSFVCSSLDFFHGVRSHPLNFRIPGGGVSMMYTLTSQLLRWRSRCSGNCQPWIQASHRQVGNLVSEDIALCSTHKYLVVWAQRRKIQRRLCIQNTHELAFKFLETFSKTIEELHINKALCIIKLQNSTVIKTHTISFPWQRDTKLLFY